MPSVSYLGPTHLGLDVHKDTISVAILTPDRDGPDVDRIPHDEASVRRLVGRLGDPRWLRACYEAGPTGYELARLLHSMGVRCEVIAPSLIPKAPGDKARDRPSGPPAAHRGCTGPENWWRSASPAFRKKRSAICAAPGPTWSKTGPAPGIASASSCCATAGPGRGGNAWTLTHERGLGSQRFHQPALAATYAHYRAVLQGRDAQLEAIQADLAVWYDAPPFAAAVHRPGRLPGHHPAGRVDAGQ